MRLNKTIFDKKQELVDLDYSFPEFDRESVIKKTQSEPTWLHLGAGNIFRAFLAPAQQQLLNEKQADTGILIAEGYDYEIVDVLREYDNLSVNVTLKESGQVQKEIVASVVDYLKMETDTADFLELKQIFKAPSLQMISLTITEKGYSLVDNQGNITSDIQYDFEHGPAQPKSYIGKLVSLLLERFNENQLPIALVSMDNMSHNGEKLQIAVERFTKEWANNKFVPQAFVEYVQDEKKVTFPWSMIDKITPRPDTTVQKMLEESGLSEMSPVETKKHTFVAPYVNGEETEYLVIEDLFPNERPSLEKAGIIFSNRETVNMVETMKVTTCLNPLHTALAIFGCLLNYKSIHEEMKDEDLVSLIKHLGYDEGLPVVVNPKIIDPVQFIDEVINVRLPNPFIPDTPQRIATDTSQKLSARFGETIKSYLKSDELEVSSLKVIPLVYAGWLRYLTGIGDDGNKFDISPDPLLKDLTPLFENFELGKNNVTTEIKQLLANEQIFGVDLVEINLADQILELFEKMSQAKGSIRQVIKETLK